jgi:hypothetical protein
MYNVYIFISFHVFLARTRIYAMKIISFINLIDRFIRRSIYKIPHGWLESLSSWRRASRQCLTMYFHPWTRCERAARLIFAGSFAPFSSCFRLLRDRVSDGGRSRGQISAVAGSKGHNRFAAWASSCM